MLRQALVVGINNYPGLQNLKTPAGDAELIASLLQKHGGFQIVKRLPVKDNEGLLSVDENPSPQQLVTSAKLKEAIADLFNPQGNDVPDTALLYFAGHGLRNDEGITEGFLATSNANPRKDVWGVSLNWLQRLLKSSPVKEQIIWLDCCYGGELLNGQFLNFDEANPGERGKGRDRCFIAACGDASVAYGNAEHGILTSLLLKGLDPQRYEVSQWINNYSLTDFIIQQLENDEKLRTFPQRPSYNNSGGEIKLIQGAKQCKVVVFNHLQNNICPYKGLAAFEFNDEDPKYFYGRTALTDELLEKLRRGNFLAVMGASGCGKSSVVKAGLLYQLKLGQRLSGSNEWKILPVIRPGHNPLYSLAEAFTGKDSKKMLIQFLEKELRDNGADRLQDFIAEDIEKYSRVVLVVDQFEEVFTLCQDIKERQQFFDCLLSAVESSNNQLCLVITIRADFVGECAAYPKLAKQIQQDLVTVTPMTTEELTEAIKEPASQVGLGLEETLVIQMIADVQKSPGSLPLLQFTLMELWEKRNINTTGNTESYSQLLTLHAYQKMGGVMGALNRHAQQIYNYTDYKSASPSQKRQPQEQELIRRIFLKLLRTGEGVKDTRQPQPKTKLMAIAGEDLLQQEALSQLIEELIKWRLLVTSEVEISSSESSEHIQIIDLNHEALMSGWEEFAQWREKYRQILRLRDRVDDALRVWDANGNKDEDLMMGGLLAKVREKWLDFQMEIDATAKEFYQYSDDYDQEQSYVQKNWRENFLENQLAYNTPDFLPQNLSSQSELQRRVIISFTGTNLLTNQIDINSDNRELINKIIRISNFTFEEVYKYCPEALDIIDILKERADKKLKNGDIQTIRRISSELNFIYAFYEQNLEQGKNDTHFLITGDTALGHTTSDIIREFLLKKGFNIGVYNPSGFSMMNYATFAGGINQLFKWFGETIPGFKERGYKVYFNLVGAPRTLQAYMDIIGMLYADELIYIFEGMKSNLINLPKIPIQINTSFIQPVEFALMEVGSIPVSEVNHVPDIFIDVIENEAVMSELGKLIWKECKNLFLSGDLLPFSFLAYNYSFRNDYNAIRNPKDRVRLNETLAKVAYLLKKFNGDTNVLRKDPGLHYQKLLNKSGIDYFRVSQGLRISCKFINGTLELRRYGNHDILEER